MAPVRFHTKTERQKLFSSTTKILFVRDPYSRIFSAYVDKLVAPNPVYWKSWGISAISKYRKTNQYRNNRNHQPADNDAKNRQGIPPTWKPKVTCAHDVTFSEFVQDAVNSRWKVDTHLKPIVDLCSPCAVSFDVIGQMSTFSDDVKMVLDSLNISPKQVGLERMANDTLVDAIEDSVRDALSPFWLKDTLRCIRLDSVFRRIWRKLQMRGFISWRRKFPFTSEELKKLNTKSFLRMLKRESALSWSNRAELQLQKTQAMREAFASVPKAEIAKIETVFANDLHLFGFDPSTYRNIGVLGVDVADTQVFDFDKDWDLSPVLGPKYS